MRGRVSVRVCAGVRIKGYIGSRVGLVLAVNVLVIQVVYKSLSERYHSHTVSTLCVPPTDIQLHSKFLLSGLRVRVSDRVCAGVMIRVQGWVSASLRFKLRLYRISATHVTFDESEVSKSIT